MKRRGAVRAALARFLLLAATAGALTAATPAAQAAQVSVDASVFGEPENIVPFVLPVNPETGQIVDDEGVPVPLSEMPYLTHGQLVVSGGNDLSATQTTVGDGINDETWWVFDFSEDADAAAFAASTDPLISAVLTLTLIPREHASLSDGTFVPGLSGAYPVEATGVVGEPLEVELQLVQPDAVASGQAHDAADILAKYFASGSFGPQNVLFFGDRELPFKFFDDADVLGARLELTRGPAVAGIPEPATVALLGLGVAGLIGGVSARRCRGSLPVRPAHGRGR